jgi:general secretion pathway protein H
MASPAVKATTPTSAPGSEPKPRRARGPGGHSVGPARGFTLLELLVVLLLVAIASGVMTLALRDSESALLEREAVRLAALLEMARAESRVSGQPVAWQPLAPSDALVSAVGNELAPDFRFAGLGRNSSPPQRWLAPGQVQARVLVAGPSAGSAARQSLWLGPDAVLPPQAVELRRGRHVVRVASDGLAPFAADAPRQLDDAGAASR